MLKTVDIVLEKKSLKSGIIIWFFNTDAGLFICSEKQNCNDIFFTHFIKLFSTRYQHFFNRVIFCLMQNYIFICSYNKKYSPYYKHRLYSYYVISVENYLSFASASFMRRIASMMFSSLVA